MQHLHPLAPYVADSLSLGFIIFCAEPSPPGSHHPQRFSPGGCALPAFGLRQRRVACLGLSAFSFSNGFSENAVELLHSKFQPLSSGMAEVLLRSAFSLHLPAFALKYIYYRKLGMRRHGYLRAWARLRRWRCFGCLHLWLSHFHEWCRAWHIRFDCL